MSSSCKPLLVLAVWLALRESRYTLYHSLLAAILRCQQMRKLRGRESETLMWWVADLELRCGLVMNTLELVKYQSWHLYRRYSFSYQIPIYRWEVVTGHKNRCPASHNDACPGSQPSKDHSKIFIIVHTHYIRCTYSGALVAGTVSKLRILLMSCLTRCFHLPASGFHWANGNVESSFGGGLCGWHSKLFMFILKHGKFTINGTLLEITWHKERFFSFASLTTRNLCPIFHRAWLLGGGQCPRTMCTLHFLFCLGVSMFQQCRRNMSAGYISRKLIITEAFVPYLQPQTQERGL